MTYITYMCSSLDVHDLVQFCFVFRYSPGRCCQVNKVEMADFGFAHFGDDDLNEEEEEEAVEVCFYYCIMCMYVLRVVSVHPFHFVSILDILVCTSFL